MIKTIVLYVVFLGSTIGWLGSTDEYTMICGTRFKSWYIYTNTYNGYRAPLEDSICLYGKEIKWYSNRTYAVDTTCPSRGVFCKPLPYKIFYVTVQDTSAGVTPANKCNPKWVRRRMVSILKDTFELQMPATDILHLSKRFSIKLTSPDGKVNYQEGKMSMVLTSNKSSL